MDYTTNTRFLMEKFKKEGEWVGNSLINPFINSI